jgi:uncharacterized protein YjeT (DUF2065 family)
MIVIAYILGFGCIAMSSCLILYTRPTVDAVKTVFRKYPLQYLSAIPAFFGIMFLIAAAATTYPWVLRVFGLLALLEAVTAFTDPKKIYSRMLDWYFEKISDQMQRLFGIIGVIFGTVILSWIK